jgi:hypothetical protein
MCVAHGAIHLSEPSPRHTILIAQNEDRCWQLFAFLTFFAFHYALFAASSVLFFGKVQKCTAWAV